MDEVKAMVERLRKSGDEVFSARMKLHLADLLEKAAAERDAALVWREAPLIDLLGQTENGMKTEAMIDGAVNAEREACANICDHEQGTAGDAADKIRMRST